MCIPKAVREQVWIFYVGNTFKKKCLTTWCSNIITPFNFHCGHDIPASKGGDLSIANLRPICASCNLSMSDTYTFAEWCKLSKPHTKWKLWMHKLSLLWTSSDTKESGSRLKQSRMSPKSKPLRSHGVKLENLL